MKKTRKILFSAALLSSGLTMAQTTTAEKSPNVIYIMADDLGIGDLGCYGQRQIKTPNIDGIAQNGMKFMQHYSGSTVSAPSRCALITGKHMGHAAIRGNAKVAGSDGLLYETPLPAGEVTVADIFKTKNYVTGCVGKWGMGGPGTEGMPGKHGFDYFYGYLGQRFAHSYYPEFLHENEQKIMLDGKYYSHDLMLEKALNFIDENAQKPFFLYFATNDVHVPRFPHDRFRGKNPMGLRGDAIVQFYYCVGEILNTLEKLGLRENTLIILSSDNGPVVDDGYDDKAEELLNGHSPAGPLRGNKYSAFEGGTRIPAILSWPKEVKKGKTSDLLVSQVDWLASLASLTGAVMPKGTAPDSYNFLGSWLGKEKKDRPWVIEQASNHTLSVRTKDWKYIEPNGGPKMIQWGPKIETGNSKEPQLYKMEEVKEVTNYASQMPEKVAELQTILQGVREGKDLIGK